MPLGGGWPMSRCQPPHLDIGLSNTKLIAALARRWLALTEQIEDLAGHMQRLLDDHAPALLSVFGCGQDTIAQLLITAGDNPDRLRSEAAFASLAALGVIVKTCG